VAVVHYHLARVDRRNGVGEVLLVDRVGRVDLRPRDAWACFIVRMPGVNTPTPSRSDAVACPTSTSPGN